MGLSSFTKKQKILLVSLLLVVIAIPLTLYLSQKTTIFKPKAGEIQQPQQQETLEDLTNQLLQAASTSDRVQTQADLIQGEQASNLISIAQRRKAKALEEIENNPENFLVNSIPKEVKELMPADIQNLIEYDATISGRLSLVHADNFDENSSTNTYTLWLDDQAQQTYTVHFVRYPPQITFPNTVTLTGTVMGSDIVLRTGSRPYFILKEPTIITQKDVAGTPKTDRMMVFLVNFSDYQEEPFQPDWATQELFTGPLSFKNYLEQISENKFNLTGKVLGWYTLPVPKPTCVKMQLKSILLKAIDAAIEHGEDPSTLSSSSYDIWVMVIPKMDCAYAGFFDNQIVLNGKNYPFILINESYIDSFNRPTPNRLRLSLAHEFGHYLGFEHASSLNCRGERGQVEYKACNIIEYGEPFDPMGNLSGFLQYSYNGFNRQKIGWMAPPQVRSVNTSGEYTLYSLGSTGVDQLLVIDKPDTNEKYYIDFRKTFDFDDHPTQTKPGVMDGVVIHTQGGNPQYLPPNWNPLYTKLLHTDQNSIRKILPNGQSFFDPVNNIRITQKSHDNTKAVLQITIGAGVCLTRDPTLSISPLAQAGRPGSARDYEITTTNNDTLSCSKRSFNVIPTFPDSNWTGELKDGPIDLGPGEMGTYTYTVTSSSEPVDVVKRHTFTLEIPVGGPPPRYVKATAEFVVFTLTSGGGLPGLPGAPGNIGPYLPITPSPQPTSIPTPYTSPPIPSPQGAVIIPSQTGCIRSPAYTGDVCNGYRLITNLQYSACYTLGECLVNQGDGSCIRPPVFQGDACTGYRLMPGISRVCYNYSDCQPKTVTSVKVDGREVDLSVDNPEIDINLTWIPGTPRMDIPALVDVTYSDGSSRVLTLLFNYLINFPGETAPSTAPLPPTEFTGPGSSIPPSSSSTPLPASLSRCGLTANGSNTDLSIVVGNNISFRLNSIPEGASSAQWEGTGGSVPSPVSGFSRGTGGVWTVIYGPYESSSLGTYTRKIVVFNINGEPICQSNIVNISVLSSISSLGQYILRYGSCGPSAGTRSGLPCESEFSCSNRTGYGGTCQPIPGYGAVPTPLPVGVTPTIRPSPTPTPYRSPTPPPVSCSRQRESCNTPAVNYRACCLGTGVILSCINNICVAR